jgi:hypothetical protein
MMSSIVATRIIQRESPPDPHVNMIAKRIAAKPAARNRSFAEWPSRH